MNTNSFDTIVSVCFCYTYTVKKRVFNNMF